MQQISKDFVAGFAFGALELARAEGVEWARNINLPNFGIGAGAGGVNLRGNGGRTLQRGVVGIYADVVPQVLSEHPGCTLTELFDYAKAINGSINRNGLQAYLATAKKNHLLRAHGSRGHMKYSLAGRSVRT